jgi:hypothetical protein
MESKAYIELDIVNLDDVEIEDDEPLFINYLLE